jgi:hypothetical protein
VGNEIRATNAVRAVSTLDDRSAVEGAESRRNLVLHYHLFKNAGSSIDEMLRRNFPGRWITQEFSTSPRARAQALLEFVQKNPEADAISSHSALLPVPRIENVRIFPILFIRHPIDRLRSAYLFERAQDAETLGSHLAKRHNFAGYLREHLIIPNHRHVRNFQTYRLSRNCAGRKNRELTRALRALEQLPFVGLVEEFEKSLKHLELLLRFPFPGFRAEIPRENVISSGTTLAERIAWVRDTLGEALYAEVCAANADDIALHKAVTHRWARPSMFYRVEGASRIGQDGD